MNIWIYPNFKLFPFQQIFEYIQHSTVEYLITYFYLQSILVDEVISNLFEEDEEAKDILDGINEFEEEEALFFIHNDSDLYENNYYVDIIESDLNYFADMYWMPPLNITRPTQEGYVKFLPKNSLDEVERSPIYLVIILYFLVTLSHTQKFQNPGTTPSGKKVRNGERKNIWKRK